VVAVSSRRQERELQIIKVEGLIRRTVLGLIRKLYGDEVSFARPLKREPGFSISSLLSREQMK
jgi:hypothetical protein